MKYLRERGQVAIVAALVLPILLGMAGLAVDYGSYAADRRQLQNTADSIALAAAQELPDADEPVTVGNDWATRNGLDTSDVAITVSGGSVEPQVHVVIERPHDFTFMKVLGVNSRTVGARATAAKLSYGGGAGVVPWSVTQDTLDASPPGSLVTIKYDASGGSNGNFGAIRIDGNGASDYEESAKYGSPSQLCASGTTGCTTSECPGPTCGETSPECDGDTCPSKPGNMTGPTRDAVDFREDHTSAGCDTFDEVFTPVTTYADELDALLDGVYAVSKAGAGGARTIGLAPNGKKDTPTNTPAPPTSTPVPATNTPGPPTDTPGPTNTPGGPTNTPAATSTPAGGGASRYGLNPNCNPWAGPGACPPAPSSADCSRRVIIIPVIDGFGNGTSDVTILRFALMFLEGYDGSKCSGNSCDVRARFVTAQISTGALTGAYDPDASIQIVKLIE